MESTESEDAAAAQNRKKRRRSVRNLRRKSIIQPFNFNRVEEDEPTKDTDIGTSQQEVYGSLWLESQEPVVKKRRRRSSMFVGLSARRLSSKFEEPSELDDDFDLPGQNRCLLDQADDGSCRNSSQQCASELSLTANEKDVDCQLGTKEYKSAVVFVNDNSCISKTKIVDTVSENDRLHKSEVDLVSNGHVDTDSQVVKQLSQDRLLPLVYEQSADVHYASLCSPDIDNDMESEMMNMNVNNSRDSCRLDVTGLDNTRLNLSFSGGADELNAGFVTEDASFINPKFSSGDTTYPADTSVDLRLHSEGDVLSPLTEANTSNDKSSVSSMSPDFPTYGKGAHFETTRRISEDRFSNASPRLKAVFRTSETFAEMKLQSPNQSSELSDLSTSDKENSILSCNNSLRTLNTTPVDTESCKHNTSPGVMSLCKSFAGKVINLVKTSPSYFTGAVVDDNVKSCDILGASPPLKSMAVTNNKFGILSPSLAGKFSGLADIGNRVIPNTDLVVCTALEDNVTSDNSTNSKPNADHHSTADTGTDSAKTESKAKESETGPIKPETSRQKAFYDTFNAICNELKKERSDSDGDRKLISTNDDTALTNESKSEVGNIDSLKENQVFAIDNALNSPDTPATTLETVDKPADVCVVDSVEASNSMATSDSSTQNDEIDNDVDLIDMIDEGESDVGCRSETGEDSGMNNVGDQAVDSVVKEFETINETEMDSLPSMPRNEVDGPEISKRINTTSDFKVVQTENHGVVGYVKDDADINERDRQIRRRRKRRAIVIGTADNDNEPDMYSLEPETKGTEQLKESVGVDPKPDPHQQSEVGAGEPSAVEKKKSRRSGNYAKPVHTTDVDVDRNTKYREKKEAILDTVECGVHAINKELDETEAVSPVKIRKTKNIRRRSFGVAQARLKVVNSIEENTGSLLTEDIEHVDADVIQGTAEREAAGQGLVGAHAVTDDGALESRIAGLNIAPGTASVKPARKNRRRSATFAQIAESADENLASEGSKQTDIVLSQAKRCLTKYTKSTKASGKYVADNDGPVALIVKSGRAKKTKNKDDTNLVCAAVNHDSGKVLSQLNEEISKVSLSEVGESGGTETTESVTSGVTMATAEHVDIVSNKRLRRRSATAANLQIQLMQQDSQHEASPIKNSRKRKLQDNSWEQIEKIYRNKNFVKPEDNKPWQTIFEEPTASKSEVGTLYGKKRSQRYIDFERPTQLKLRRRIQKAVKNGWDPKKKRRTVLKDDVVESRLAQLWAEIERDEEERDENSLQNKLKSIIETQ